ncbi:unnamed protein product [Coregonus sp. 'balchen']|nr:unnamed protein product [Coregonus sp. 'balchen']
MAKFDPCVTDFPEKGCHVIVSAGNNELNFQVKLPNEQMKEGSFKVTRMRCWRVTSSQFPVANGTASPSPSPSPSPCSAKCDLKLELAFEYLMSKDRLQWVTITSPQMLRKRPNGSLHRSESQQAVKSPPLLTKLSSVSLRGISASNSANDVSGNDFHGNYAFEGIGDDDL